MAWPQVWLRRQEASQQWMLTRPALMEGVERTNAVMIHLTQRVGLVQHNFYVMKMDREKNCYSCGGFGHLVQNCRR